MGKPVGTTSPTQVKGEVKTQLIAHDQEVYDIAFKPGEDNTFASVGADGTFVKTLQWGQVPGLHSHRYMQLPPPLQTFTGTTPACPACATRTKTKS